MTKKMHIIGGGTFSHVRCHLSLAAPAFGQTAKKLYENALASYAPKTGSKAAALKPELHLTAMASGGGGNLVTNKDVSYLVEKLIADDETGMIIFNPALCDFRGTVLKKMDWHDWDETPSGKYETRLNSHEFLFDKKVKLIPDDKIIAKIRAERKDIFLVGFKTTAGATEDEQYFAGLRLLKSNSCNLVLANDVITRTNMVITPEEARYHVTKNRDEALDGLLEMAMLRYGLAYNRTEIVPGEPVSWNSERIPETLRAVVDHCIEEGAYKPIRGKTVGHFSFRESETKYLVSRRKVDFNRLEEFGVVEVEIDEDYKIKAHGSKPSAGAQTQRLIFNDHPQYNCIIHFHCPLKEGSEIPLRSQYEFECGSMQCGTNTSQGLKQFDDLSAVMLAQHGPNIVFHHSVDPQKVIAFIEENCDLSKKTGGYNPELAQ